MEASLVMGVMIMDTNSVEIKPLPEPVEVTFEQYECKNCTKKFYINAEDKPDFGFKCPFCEGETKNIRIFMVSIKGIGEY